MIRIRLARVGKKGRPSYRIVVADVAAPRDGSYLEWIGNYDPMTNPPSVTLKEDRASHWLEMGAIPSDAVSRILDRNGLMERTHTFKTQGKVAAGAETAAPSVAVATAAADEAPADQAPADQAPADQAPADQAPADEAPVEETAEEDAPTEEPPAEEASSGDEESAE